MTTFRSMPEMFLHRVKTTPDAPAYLFSKDGAWPSISWKETSERVRAIAGGLRALGLKDEERVAIFSGTRIEWILADLGILCAAGATTTIYPANTPDEAAYIISDSDTVFVFAEDDSQVQKLRAERSKVPTLKNVIVFDGKGSDDGWVITLADLEQKGKGYTQEEFEKTALSVRNDSLATLIYTSGTTGRPKGVELTQDCWVYEGEAMAALGVLRPDDLQYFWLPLAHSFGKVLQAGQIYVGFPTAVDGRVDKLVENLGVVKPTFIAAVPRIFEKVYNKVIGQAQTAGGLKYKIFQWAVGVGREVSRLRQGRKEPSGLLALQYKVADTLVFSKLRAKFGGRLRFFISGSAPLAKDLAEFFHGAGILVLEGYGLTETSAATYVNRLETFKFGTVGMPLQGTSVKIAEDGEILLKGRGVMRGYHNLPEATAETLTEDGWLRTGDIGEVDADGCLKITDRKKDLIKTSGGKYIAPQALESKLKLQSRYISQVVIHGNNRNFCSALITINEEEIVTWATQQGLGGKTYTEISSHEKTYELIESHVKAVNATLAKYETIKRFALLPSELSIESGEMTPSLKVKRKAVEAKYKKVLDDFYSGAIAGD